MCVCVYFPWASSHRHPRARALFENLGASPEGFRSCLAAVFCPGPAPAPGQRPGRGRLCLARVRVQISYRTTLHSLRAYHLFIWSWGDAPRCGRRFVGSEFASVLSLSHAYICTAVPVPTTVVSTSTSKCVVTIGHATRSEMGGSPHDWLLPGSASSKWPRPRASLKGMLEM